MSEISGIKKKLLEFIKCNDSVNLEKKSKESLDKYPNDIDLIQYYAIGLLQNNKKKESIEIFKLEGKQIKKLNLLLSTRFPAVTLSIAHVRADWLHNWSSAAKWA